MSTTPTETVLPQDEKTIIELYEMEFSNEDEDNKKCSHPSCSAAASWRVEHHDCVRFLCALHRGLDEINLFVYLIKGPVLCARCKGEVTEASQVTYRPL